MDFLFTFIEQDVYHKLRAFISAGILALVFLNKRQQETTRARNKEQIRSVQGLGFSVYMASLINSGALNAGAKQTASLRMSHDVREWHRSARHPVGVSVVFKLQKELSVLRGVAAFPRLLHHDCSVERGGVRVHGEHGGALRKVDPVPRRGAPGHGDDGIPRQAVHRAVAFVRAPVVVRVHDFVRAFVRQVLHHHRNDPLLRARPGIHLADVRRDALAGLRRKGNLFFVALWSLEEKCQYFGPCVLRNYFGQSENVEAGFGKGNTYLFRRRGVLRPARMRRAVLFLPEPC
jgi:hypothetical protein